MTDFVGKTVYHTSNGNSLLFGRVKGQVMRKKWLWLHIDWEDASSTVHPWQKAAHVGIFEKDELVDRIERV